MMFLLLYVCVFAIGSAETDFEIWYVTEHSPEIAFPSFGNFEKTNSEYDWCDCEASLSIQICFVVEEY